MDMECTMFDHDHDFFSMVPPFCTTEDDDFVLDDDFRCTIIDDLTISENTFCNAKSPDETEFFASKINPDDFLNDVEEWKTERSDRYTSPSPSDSTSSKSSALGLCQSTSLFPETPPISPESGRIFDDSPSRLFSLDGIPAPVYISAPSLQSRISAISANPLTETVDKIRSNTTIIFSSTSGPPKKNIQLKPKATPKILSKAESPELKPNQLNRGNNSILNEEIFKKRQRMIKNRQSAVQSRKKKTDYYASLEVKCNQLEEENVSLKTEIENLRRQLAQTTCSCRVKSINYTKPNQTLRKNAAVLLAMVFMVSINFGGTFKNYYSQKSLEGTNEKEVHLGRSLLWIESNKTQSGSETYFNTSLRELKSSKCPPAVNQTENIRLAAELKKLIGPQNISIDLVGTEKFKLNSMPNYPENLQSIYKKPNAKRKILKIRTSTVTDTFEKSALDKSLTLDTTQFEVFNTKKKEHKYAELFEEINRRDDTFYVLSFGSNNILLPAEAYNQTSRPRVSLMLPSGDRLLNGKVTLMQIDCEVLNTSMINLKQKFVAHYLRSNTKYNAPEKNTTSNYPSYDVPNNVDSKADLEEVFFRKNKDFEKIHKPYFISKNLLGNNFKRHFP